MMTMKQAPQVTDGKDLLPGTGVSIAELSERIEAVYVATENFVGREDGTESYFSGIPNGLEEHDAQLYFQYTLDEPRLFMLKVFRRFLLWPLLKRQVRYNISLRNAVLDLWRERNVLRKSLAEAQKRITMLENSVAAIEAKMDTVRSNGN